jgi:glycosyltransferase involved in cell wall biosynthesis
MRLSDLARRLSGRGHAVTVLTAFPNYPKGEIFAGYRGRMVAEEQECGVRIVRTWIFASASRGFVSRLLNYFSFVASSFLLGAWKTGPVDYVVVESPPLFLGISGYLLALFRGAGLVMNISDLWPASAVALGVVRSPVVISLSTRLEEFLYRGSRFITGQTEGIVADIRDRSGGRPVFLMTNGVDMDRFPPRPDGARDAALARELGIDVKFVAGYAGLHGLAQGLDTVLEVARLLADRPDMVIALVGNGPEKKSLAFRSAAQGLRNVRFIDAQPAGRMPAVLALFDAALIPLKRHPLFAGALPSKMFEAMAAGIPLVLSVEGEASRLVEKAQAGICVEPENAGAIAGALVRLHEDKAAGRTMGGNGRQYVQRHYNRETIAAEFEKLLIGHHDARQA